MRLTLARIDDAPLARSLLALLRDPGLRRRIGEANRARAARDYDQETMFQAYAALFEQCPPLLPRARGRVAKQTQ